MTHALQRLRLLPLAAAMGLCVPAVFGGARAAETTPVRTAQSQASLITSTDAYRPGEAFQVGLRLVLPPGWHTYWSNPGDAGAAPTLSLDLPPGDTAGPIVFPAPSLIPESGLASYAYTGEVVLPVTVRPAAGAHGALPIVAHAAYLSCAAICVPQEASFRLALPEGTPAPSAQAPLFAAAAARTPRPSPFAVHLSPDGLLSVAGAGFDLAGIRSAAFFPDAAGRIVAAAPQTLRRGDGWIGLRLRLQGPAAPLAGVLELTDAHGGMSAYTVAAMRGAPPGPATSEPASRTVAGMLGLALLGGLILNLMPCVFPILAMKAVGFARLSGAPRRAIRLEAAFYTLGVLAAFLALGLVLLGFRLAGRAEGWGFQLQSPPIVGGLAWLLFVVGLNLSGVFEFGAGLAGVGAAGVRRGHLGSFATGLLAVVVASPCTAPFMAAALAAALAASPPVMLGVFAALGLGLAAPTALLALLPALARALPLPGPWMVWFKQLLAFPMYAASVWLLWVLSEEAGPPGVLAGLAGLLLLGFGAWLYGATARLARRPRRASETIACVAVLAALALLPGLAGGGAAPSASLLAGASRYSPARLQSLRAAHRPVLVDVGAAWCLSCLVNERVALSPARPALAAAGVTLLYADWTRQDPTVTAYLQGFRHVGVPLYVYYPAEGPPVVLPEILTEAEVLGTIRPKSGRA